MSDTARTVIKLLADILLMNAATLAACVLKFDTHFPAECRELVVCYAALLTSFRLSALFLVGVYRSFWRYSSMEHMLGVLAGTTIGSVAFYFAMLALGPDSYLLPLLIIDWLVCVALLGGARAAYKVALCASGRPFDSAHPSTPAQGGMARSILSRWPGSSMRRARTLPKRVLVMGAGHAGAAAVAEMKRQRNGYQPIGFVDDDRAKVGRSIQGVQVIGTSEDIPSLVAKHSVDEIVIACPSAPTQRLNDIISLVRGTPARVRLLPSLDEILSGEARLQHPDNINAEDLLERGEVDIDTGTMGKCITGKRVLVSGAGGSIGSELCRQIAKLQPSHLYLLDLNENGIFEVEQEMKAHQSLNCVPIVADVRDPRRLRRIFEEHRPDAVFHAAAHKHVPLMELYPEEAIKTNIFGTRNIARCAVDNGCSKFVLVSTDKAVSPSSVMGASKRTAEMIVQDMAGEGRTSFVTVRFGNVLDSRGSLLPNLKRQIANGGPVTITHPEMERYFMTIPEAVRLVLLVAAVGKNGQLALLDMGQPVNILKLADKLIRLCGKVPGVDIGIEFTGIRPGEKLTETLLNAAEGAAMQRVGQFFVVSREPVDGRRLRECLRRLESRLPELESADARIFIQELVPDYNPMLPAVPDSVEEEGDSVPLTHVAVSADSEAERNAVGLAA